MPIKFGNLDISSMSFGSLPVDKLYFGSQAIYESGPSVDPVLENNDWATIKAVCEAGLAADYWAVGDTKTDLGTDGTTRTFRIVDMQGLYNKHVVFESVGLEEQNSQWNAKTNVDDDGCWNNYSISNIRTTGLPAVILKLSSDLQNALTNTTVQTIKNYLAQSLVSTTDKLFLAAYKELTETLHFSCIAGMEFNALTTFSYYVTHNSWEDYPKTTNVNGTSKSYALRSPCNSTPGTNQIAIVGNSINLDPLRSSSMATAITFFSPCFSF